MSCIPCLRYQNAPAAIEWLCSVFGFTQKMVVQGENGTIAHAELQLGNGMIMVGSAVATEFGRYMKQPDEIGGAETQAPYLVIPDTDTAHARAVAFGAKIIMPLKDEDYGGRGFGCRDLEGHIWYVGTYDPFAVGNVTDSQPS